MIRKIVQTGSSLAVTLPREVVEELKLKKGDDVEVSVHPQTSAIIVRAGIRYLEDGKVTENFRRKADEIIKRHHKAFERLSK